MKKKEAEGNEGFKMKKTGAPGVLSLIGHCPWRLPRSVETNRIQPTTPHVFGAAVSA